MTSFQGDIDADAVQIAHSPSAAYDAPQWLRRVDGAALALLNIALVLQVGTVALNTVLRWVLNQTVIFGVDELSQLYLIAVAYLGGAVAYGRNQFICINYVVDLCPASVRPILAAAVQWVVIAIALTIGGYSIPLIIINGGEKTPYFEIAYIWMTIPMTIGAVLFCIHAGRALLKLPPMAVVGTGAIVAAICIALVLCQGMDWTATPLLYPVLAAVFIVGLAIGVPVGFVLAAVGIVYVAATGSVPSVAIALRAQKGVGSFIFLALPFFILAGFIMDRAGIGARIITFLSSLLGHFRGGLLQVAIISMYIVSGISGSKAADMAAVGIPLNKIIRRHGYEGEEAAAVLAASGAMGESIPPSIAILTLGSVTSISTGELFLGGVLPAAVIALCLMVLVYIRSRMSAMQPAARAPMKTRLIAGRAAIISLLMPVLLIGGIVGGLGTPTEISSFAVLYGLILGTLLYRQIDFRTIWAVLTETTQLSGMIFFTFSGAALFSWALSLAGIPTAIATALQELGPTVFFPAMILMTIILGALLESIVTVVVLGPLLLPVALHLGIHPVQFGIVLIEAFGIGGILPPVGLGLYISCSIFETKVERTGGRLLFYLLALAVGLLLVAFIPWITLIVPQLAGFDN